RDQGLSDPNILLSYTFLMQSWTCQFGQALVACLSVTNPSRTPSWRGIRNERASSTGEQDAVLLRRILHLANSWPSGSPLARPLPGVSVHDLGSVARTRHEQHARNEYECHGGPGKPGASGQASGRQTRK